MFATPTSALPAAAGPGRPHQPDRRPKRLVRPRALDLALFALAYLAILALVFWPAARGFIAPSPEPVVASAPLAPIWQDGLAPRP